MTREVVHGGPSITLHSTGESTRGGFQPRATAYPAFQRQSSEAHPTCLQHLSEHLAHTCGWRGLEEGLMPLLGVLASSYLLEAGSQPGRASPRTWEHVHVLMPVHVRGGSAKQLPEAT